MSKKSTKKAGSEGIAGAESVPMGLTHENIQRVFWVILGLAVLLRLVLLPRESIWFDEAATTGYLSEPTFSEFVQALRHYNPDVPPVYLWLEYHWAGLFGSNAISLRILSFIPGVLSILLGYVLVKRLHTAEAALITAYLLAVSSTHIYYSLEIRMYSLLICLLVFSIYSYFRILDTHSSVWWMAHVVTTIVIIYTHQLGILILPCLAAHAWFYGFSSNRTKAIWTGLHTLAVATFIPYFLLHEREGFGDIYNTFKPPLLFASSFDPNEPSLYHTFAMWMTPPGHWNNWDSTYQWLGSFNGMLLRLGNLLAVLVFVISPFLFARLLMNTIREKGIRSEEAGRLLFWCVLFLAPILLLFVVSHIWRPIFMARYLLLQMIAMIICVSVSIAAIKNDKVRIALVITLAIGTLLQALVDIQYSHRGSWTAIARYVDNDPHPSPRVHIFSGSKSELEYANQYLKWNVTRPSAELFPYTELNQLDEYLLGHYVKLNNEGDTKYYGDCILVVDPNSVRTVQKNLDDRGIRYIVKPISGRDFHTLFVLNPI